jgi:hypothetical protein
LNWGAREEVLATGLTRVLDDVMVDDHDDDSKRTLNEALLFLQDGCMRGLLAVLVQD